MTSPQTVLNQYEATFGVDLLHPPLDYGYFTTEQLAEIAEAALAKSEPVTNWSEYLAPLPDDADG